MRTPIQFRLPDDVMERLSQLKEPDLSKALAQYCQTEVEHYERWFRKNVQSPLNGPFDKNERALLVTFLYRKLRGDLDKEEEQPK
jgi:hypothetical protein